MDANIRDIMFLWPCGRSSELCTLVLFFVSLDQLLCKQAPLPPMPPIPLPVLQQSERALIYLVFSFYKATFSRRSLSVFAPAFSVIVKGVLCAHFRKIKHNLSLDATVLYKKWSTLFLFCFFQVTIIQENSFK